MDCLWMFNEKSFFNTLLGFTPYWEYKPTNVIPTDSPGVYTSETKLTLFTKDRIPLNGFVTDGSVVNGIREPKLFILR